MPVRLSRVAFIVRGPGYHPEVHRTSFVSPSFSTVFVGVSSVDEATAIAAALADEGVQIIELCGGFTATEARRVRSRLGGSVPVGVVRFDAAGEREIARRFST
jgi:hypothetical protein